MDSSRAPSRRRRSRGQIDTGTSERGANGLSHHEGRQVADWLNHLGISAFILKYRLGPAYHYPIELWDVQRAIRYVRAHASDFGIRADRIGIWGFSAGGHLASMAGTHFDPGNRTAADPIERQSSRPDFMILAYPVITMQEPFVHLGSRANLLGERPDPALVRLLSSEQQVTSTTPPTFLFHTLENYTPLRSRVIGRSCTWYPSFFSCVTSRCRLRFNASGVGVGPYSTYETPS